MIAKRPSHLRATLLSKDISDRVRTDQDLKIRG